jgi:hypothetical protein
MNQLAWVGRESADPASWGTCSVGRQSVSAASGTAVAVSGRETH